MPCVPSFPCRHNTALPFPTVLLVWVSLDVWLLAGLKCPGTQQWLSCDFYLISNSSKKYIHLNLHLICQGNSSWERALYSKWMFEIIPWEDITKSWSMIYSLWKPDSQCLVFLTGCSASRESYLLQSFFHHDLVTRHNHPHNTWTFYPTDTVFPHTYIPLCHQDCISGNTTREDSVDGSYLPKWFVCSIIPLLQEPQ